jgi:UDP-N-acetylglucosamine diphosphorylase/glucosamine-1-phosphate N-acetyltransferase
MAELYVFEDEGSVDLLPLVYWRACCDLRCGRTTLLKKIELLYGIDSPRLLCRPELVEVTAERHGVPVNRMADADGALLLLGRCVFPRPVPLDGPEEVGVVGETVVYARLSAERAARVDPAGLAAGGLGEWAAGLPRRGVDTVVIRYPWDLVRHNHEQLEADFARIEPRREGRVDPGAVLLNERQIHIAPGARVMPCAVLNAENGSIYVGRDVTISPNCSLEGPCSIGSGSLVQPCSVLRGGTTIGPVCKVGGEIEESIIWGYSNKQHDGFLGHAVLGQWINLAADSVNSDLKNTYGTVRVRLNGREIDTGERFLGLTMGDHSKCGINAKFATGTIVGFACNIVTSKFPPKFIRSFSWLSDEGYELHDPRRAVAVAERVMARRQRRLTEAQVRLFGRIYELHRQHEYPDLND